MKTWFEQNKVALMQASVVFASLFTVVVILTLYYDFSGIDMGGLLFVTALLCCTFVAKNTYDIAKVTINNEELGKVASAGLTLDSEELYIKLYENSPVPYLIISSDGHVSSANTSAIRLLGLSQKTVIGINIFNRLSSDSDGHLDLIIEKYRNQLSVSGEMVQIQRKDDHEAWALMSLFSFVSSDGDIIGLLTLVDITKQKKAEDAKSEFVSLASHQLRTPIAGMKWSAELLQIDNPENLTERQSKYIDRLLISIKRMATLVDDFLRVSRFELGTFHAEYGEFSLVELFKDVMSEQTIKVKKKKLTVRTFFDKSLDMVVLDQNLVRMVVTNLYSNAVKYTREKGTIHLGFKQKDGELIITVQDNGMGIPVEDQDQIFSKLFRAANAVRDVPDGTGLGLYIVYEAVSVMHGNITFTTTENVGTTFEVILPIDESQS